MNRLLPLLFVLIVGTVAYYHNSREDVAVENQVVVRRQSESSKEVEAVSVHHLRSPIYNTLYDASFKKWNSVYNDYPWQWNKAQAIAESNLNPDAVSPVGAMGISQFMPETWKDMQNTLGIRGSAFNSTLNIQAQSYYMQQLRGQFKAQRPEHDKHSLALASYNAGLGNILKAQAYENSLMYSPMIRHLPRVTGVANAKQTKDYVERTWRYVKEMEEHLDD